MHQCCDEPGSEWECSPWDWPWPFCLRRRPRPPWRSLPSARLTRSEVTKQTKASGAVAKEMESGKWSSIKSALLSTFNGEANAEKQFNSFLNGASAKVKAAAAVALQLDSTFKKVIQQSTSLQQFETRHYGGRIDPQSHGCTEGVGQLLEEHLQLSDRSWADHCGSGAGPPWGGRGDTSGIELGQDLADDLGRLVRRKCLAAFGRPPLRPQSPRRNGRRPRARAAAPRRSLPGRRGLSTAGATGSPGDVATAWTRDIASWRPVTVETAASRSGFCWRSQADRASS